MEVVSYVVEAFFRALANEKEALEKIELLFRQQILRSLNDIKDVTASLSEDLRRKVGSVVAIAVARIPIQQWLTEYSPVGELLRVDIDDPVPFYAGEEEIEDFTTGAMKTEICLFGLSPVQGGIGKSRFMIEAPDARSFFGAAHLQGKEVGPAGQDPNASSV